MFLLDYHLARSAVLLDDVDALGQTDGAFSNLLAAEVIDFHLVIVVCHLVNALGIGVEYYSDGGAVIWIEGAIGFELDRAFEGLSVES